MNGSEGSVRTLEAGEEVYQDSEHYSNSDLPSMDHELQAPEGGLWRALRRSKGLKGPILDWITPRGQSLDPPLSRNVKVNRGFHHERTGSLLCPAGMDWNDLEYVVLLHFD